MRLGLADSLVGQAQTATAPLPDSMAYIATDRTGRFLLGASFYTWREAALGFLMGTLLGLLLFGVDRIVVGKTDDPRRIVVDDLALLHHDDAVAQPLDLGQDVAGQQHRASLAALTLHGGDQLRPADSLDDDVDLGVDDQSGRTRDRRRQRDLRADPDRLPASRHDSLQIGAVTTASIRPAPGSPAASRTIAPPGGFTESRVMPAARNAAVFSEKAYAESTTTG